MGENQLVQTARRDPVMTRAGWFSMPSVRLPSHSAANVRPAARSTRGWVPKGWSTLIAALVSAVTATVVLVAAIVLGNTLLAAVAVGIALLGLSLLGRDWLRERRDSATDVEADQRSDRLEPGDNGLTPELFRPDVSYEEAVNDVDDDQDFDLEGNA
jgi:hypothetical protein